MNRLNSYFKKVFIPLVLWSLLLPVTLAQTSVSSGSGSGPGLTNPIHASSFTGLLNDILAILIQIGTPVLIIAFVWVGFLFINARGKPEDINKAKEALKWTLIGAAIVIGAKAITIIICSTINNISPNQCLY